MFVKQKEFQSKYEGVSVYKPRVVFDVIQKNFEKVTFIFLSFINHIKDNTWFINKDTIASN